jgi:uncharacterized protein (TIRG00374 family)
VATGGCLKRYWRELIGEIMGKVMAVVANHFSRKIKIFAKKNKWLRLLVSLLFVIWVVWRVDWHQILYRVAFANIGLVLFATVVGFGTLWLLSAWRWQILLNSFGIRYSLRKVFELYFIGFFAGFLLSDSIGPFARGFYVKNEGHSVARAMVTIFLDKMLSFVGLLAFSLVGVVVFSNVITHYWVIWFIPMVIAIGIGGGWFLRGKLGFWISQSLDNLLASRLHLATKNPTSKVYEELSSISISVWLEVAFVTVLCRLVHYGAVYMLARSLGITISYMSIVAVMSLVGVAVVLPIAVAGGIGVREGVLVGLFVLLGQEKELALSLALLIFFSSLVWRAVGMVLWLRNPLGKNSKVKLGSKGL